MKPDQCIVVLLLLILAHLVDHWWAGFYIAVAILYAALATHHDWRHRR